MAVQFKVRDAGLYPLLTLLFPFTATEDFGFITKDINDVLLKKTVSKTLKQSNGSHKWQRLHIYAYRKQGHLQFLFWSCQLKSMANPYLTANVRRNEDSYCFLHGITSIIRLMSVQMIGVQNRIQWKHLYVGHTSDSYISITYSSSLRSLQPWWSSCPRRSLHVKQTYYCLLQTDFQKLWCSCTLSNS